MDMSTEEEATPNDINMTTSERVSTNILRCYISYIYIIVFAITDITDDKFALPFQVVDLLNQAALISSDEKLTVLKQVCCYFKNLILQQ